MALYKKVSANRAMQTGKRVPLNDEGMPIDRGLPAVPRGLNREMTAYLQSMHNVVLSMTGLGRGTTDTRAVRVNEALYGTGGSGSSDKDFLDAGSIQTAHLVNGAVTEPKIADQAVTHSKLGISAVESNNIKPQAVDNPAIKDGAITAEKLDPKLWPVFVAGNSEHGATVNLGKWLSRPLVILTGQRIPIGECGELCAGIENLREENGVWMFDAVAVFEMGIEEEATAYPGEISWLAVGRRENNAGA